MTARFVYWMNVSLDLFIEGGPNEHGDLDGPDWVRIDEQLHREFNARAAALSTMVQGRVVYELMDPFWPDARDNESFPDYLREYGEIWTSKPKVLVSRTRHEAGHDTRVIGGTGSGSAPDDAIEQLAELRATGSGDIGVGGSNVASQLLRAHLLDEVMLFTHPTILGSGRPLFDRVDEPVSLDLIEQRSFDQGVTLHRYSVRGALPSAG